MTVARQPYVFCEPFAGSAAVTYWLLGGKPPISYLGSKQGYATVIADILGLSQHHRPAGIILGEPGPFAAVHATLGGASGSAEDVAGWVHANAVSMVKDGNASGYSHVNGEGHHFTNNSGKHGYWTPTTPEISAARVEEVMPAARQVAAIIRSWKDEEPRALWERLKAKGWPSLLLPEGFRGRWLGPQSVEDVATVLTCHIWQHPAGDKFAPSKAYPVYFKDDAGNVTGTWIPTDPAKLSASVESLPTFPALAVWQGVAEELALPADLTGFHILMDPPYKGDLTGKITGYKHGDCSRETVLRLALDYSRRGAVVAICESVRLDRDLGDGWTAVDISHARKGQVRSFTRNQGNNRKEPQEWVTLNRPPVHVPGKQVGLFA